MNTKFSDIYPIFLSQIDDYEIYHLDQEEVEIHIEKYLINGLLTIHRHIKKALDINEREKSFNHELALIEKLLIAKSMKLEWIREKKNNLELMRKSVGDRDFKAIQGTDILKELSKVESDLRKEIEQEMVDYSYSENEGWKGLHQR